MAALETATGKTTFSLPTNGEHPADLLDGAGAVLGFLNLMFAESTGGQILNDRDTYGLCLILGGVQDSVDRAAKLF